MCKYQPLDFGKVNKAGQTESVVRVRRLTEADRAENTARTKLACSKHHSVLCRSTKNPNAVYRLELPCKQVECPSCGSKLRADKVKQGKANFGTKVIWRYTMATPGGEHWSNEMASKCRKAGANYRWVCANRFYGVYMWYTDKPIQGMTGDMFPAETALMDYEARVWDMPYVLKEDEARLRWTGCSKGWKVKKAKKVASFQMLNRMGRGMSAYRFKMEMDRIRLRLGLTKEDISDPSKITIEGSDVLDASRVRLKLDSHEDLIKAISRALPNLTRMPKDKEAKRKNPFRTILAGMSIQDFA